jgi:hypothetical protein
LFGPIPVVAAQPSPPRFVVVVEGGRGRGDRGTTVVVEGGRGRGDGHGDGVVVVVMMVVVVVQRWWPSLHIINNLVKNVINKIKK